MKVKPPPRMTLAQEKAIITKRHDALMAKIGIKVPTFSDWHWKAKVRK